MGTYKENPDQVNGDYLVLYKTPVKPVMSKDRKIFNRIFTMEFLLQSAVLKIVHI